MKKEFFISNRKKLSEELNNNEVMIVFAGKDIRESEDEAYKFVINRNFYYLTGVNEQNDIVVLAKENGVVTEKIFINKYDEFEAKWLGRKLFDTEITEISGITDIDYLDNFDSYVETLVNKHFSFLLEIKKNLFAEPFGEPLRLSQKLVEKGVNVSDCHDYFIEYRNKKVEEEIDNMRQAISITNKGILAMMSNAKPNMFEYQIESYFDQQIKFNGASGTAFKTIAAAGKNACVLHYSQNNNIVNDNELILCDLGAEYNLYKADITRTFPVNGKFTDRQKEIYNIVLKGQQLIIDSIYPGVTLGYLNQKLVDYYKVELPKHGLLKDVSTYYFHGVSHHLGLDTHDIASRGKAVTEGSVITVEPGLYILDESIGIRIEDDVLVTSDGCEVLSKEIIKTVEEIENFMNK